MVVNIRVPRLMRPCRDFLSSATYFKISWISDLGALKIDFLDLGLGSHSQAISPTSSSSMLGSCSEPGGRALGWRPLAGNETWSSLKKWNGTWKVFVIISCWLLAENIPDIQKGWWKLQSRQCSIVDLLEWKSFWHCSVSRVMEYFIPPIIFKPFKSTALIVIVTFVKTRSL